MITSKQNSFIKEIRSLSLKKNRDELGLYVVEGVKAVKEALSSQQVKAVVCTERGQALLGEVKIRTELVSNEVFKSISGEVTPQGIIAVVVKPQNALRAPSGNCVLLDGVSNPANVGAIIRSAAAAGYSEVFITNDSADAFGDKAVRASMGGLYKVSVYYGEREELISVINKPFVIADMGGENVFETKIKNEFCLVVGNEGNGVSQRLKDVATVTVSIPMENGMESLNVAVSAGILMYLLKHDRR